MVSGFGGTTLPRLGPFLPWALFTWPVKNEPSGVLVYMVSSASRVGVLPLYVPIMNRLGPVFAMFSLIPVWGSRYVFGFPMVPLVWLRT